MAKALYVLLNNENLNPILWEEPDDTAFKALKQSLMNPPSLGYPNYQIPFFLLVYEKKGNALGVLTLKHRDHLRPKGYYSRQRSLWHWDTPLALKTLLLLLF